MHIACQAGGSWREPVAGAQHADLLRHLRGAVNNLELPSDIIWSDRRDWFENQVAEYQGNGSYLLSEQACALMMEVQVCYCAGAWIAVLVLAYTVIDAQLLETEAPGFDGNSAQLLRHLNFSDEYQQLRLRRNRIVHLRCEQPAITVDQQWGFRKELEAEAQAAVRLMLAAFFNAPGT